MKIKHVILGINQRLPAESIKQRCRELSPCHIGQRIQSGMAHVGLGNGELLRLLNSLGHDDERLQVARQLLKPPLDHAQ